MMTSPNTKRKVKTIKPIKMKVISSERKMIEKFLKDCKQERIEIKNQLLEIFSENIIEELRRILI